MPPSLRRCCCVGLHLLISFVGIESVDALGGGRANTTLPNVAYDIVGVSLAGVTEATCTSRLVVQHVAGRNREMPVGTVTGRRHTVLRKVHVLGFCSGQPTRQTS